MTKFKSCTTISVYKEAINYKLLGLSVICTTTGGGITIKQLAKKSLSCIAILFGLALSVVYAAPSNQNSVTNIYDTVNGNTHLSYMPRVYLDGAAGYSSGSLYLGEAKILQPILMRYNLNFYAYGEGRFSNATESWQNSPWSGTLGLGYRQIIGQSVVLGGYVLGGYTKTPDDHSILFVNPGFEALGKVWEFRLNGYFPVSKTKWDTSGWADNFGNNSYVMYQGHDEYDAMFTYHETAGMGADTQIGRKLFKLKNILVKGYLEGYYFSEGSNDAVRGGGATISVQPYSYLKVSLTDTYDNYAHNTAMLGVEVSLYDLFSGNHKTTDDLDLTHRLYEPIQNDFAAAGSGNVIPTACGPGRGNPDLTQYYPPSMSLTPGNGALIPLTPPYQLINNWTNHVAPERTNVWFFNAAGNAGLTGGQLGADENGTYEHPFTGQQLSQGEFNEAAQYGNASLYFSQGTYYSYIKNADGSYSPIELLQGESIYGRNSGGSNNPFLNSATAGNAANFSGPIFQGSFKMDSNTSLNYIQLLNVQNNGAAAFAQGVSMQDATGVQINDTKIGADGGVDSGGYANGVLIDNSSQQAKADLTLNNSEVHGYSTNSDGIGLAVKNGGNTDIYAYSSTIEGHSVNGNGIGLDVVQDSHGQTMIGNLTSNGLGNDTNGATFEGVSDSSAKEGIGLDASSYVASGDAYIRIGKISGLNFKGLNAGGGSAYGLIASAIVAGGTGNILVSIGDIANSEFFAAKDIGNDSVDKTAAGFYASSGASNGNATTEVGNILGSSFYGDGDNGYGMYVSSQSLSVAGAATTSIGQIGNQNTTSQRNKFVGSSASGAGYGLYVETAGSLSQSATNTNIITINSIYNSDFIGTGLDKASGILVGDSDGNKATVNLNRIESSNFTGNTTDAANNNKAYGFDLEMAGVTQYSRANITDFNNDNFTANAYGGKGWATALNVYSYSTDGRFGIVNINSIKNSSFNTGNADASAKLWLSTGLNFYATTVGLDYDSGTGKYKYNAMDGTKLNDIKTYLTSSGNAFSLASTWNVIVPNKGEVCIYYPNWPNHAVDCNNNH